MPSLTLAEIAQYIDARLVGDGEARVDRVAPVQDAGPGALTFVSNPRYQAFLDGTQATAVIVNEALVSRCPGNALVSSNPYLAYARASHLFERLPRPVPGIHPTAVIDPSAQLAGDVHIGAHAVIEAGVQLRAGCVVGAQCFVGDGSRLGAGCRLYPNVTIYPGVTIGERTIIHAGVVIGADGFGFANDKGRWEKVAQLGGVVIGDDCEIGALTTIDRGAIGDTVIGNNVILDNQVHIAHNAQVGDHTAMAGKSGVSGSSKVGRHCLISGMSGLVGHIEICDNVQVSAMTPITRSIDKPGTYTGGVGMHEHGEWLRNAARFRQLDAMARRLAELEKRLAAIERDDSES